MTSEKNGSSVIVEVTESIGEEEEVVGLMKSSSDSTDTIGGT